MKLKSKIMFSVIALLGIQLNGLSQTFVMPGQLLNSFGPGVMDSGYGVGGMVWGTGTLSNTVIVNPTAYTIDQSGSISLSAATATFSATETEDVIVTTVIQDFPQPPMTVTETNPVTGNWTVSLDFSGGTFSYDTGAQSLVWNGSSYNYNGNASIQVPISVSYSLVTGGQTYTGTDINEELNFPLTLGSELNTANYPTSVSLSPAAGWVDDPAYSRDSVAGFTAANGFQANLFIQVPEPATWALFGSALLALKLIKRRA